jgi:Na+/melibiose symporter-like transporter
VGNLVAGFILDIIDFPVNSKPGLVPEDVLFHFGGAYCLILLTLIFSTWAFWPYGLDKERHTDILRQLKDRIAARQPEPEPDLGPDALPVSAD